MSFVMIATGPASRSRVRTLPLRPLLLAAAVAALLLLAAGVALGQWWSSAWPATAAPAVAVNERPARAMLPFALEQVGALSARLFQLESQASQLSQRLGLTPARKAAPASAAAASGSGGPMLPPRADNAVDLVALQDRLAQLEQELARAADVATERSLENMRQPSRAPIQGAELVSLFGNREDPFTHHKAFHSGLDFAAAYGSPIRAAAGGTVRFAGYRSDFGWMVEIDHGNGLSTRYAHASKLLVQAGSIVAPGDRVALVGSTGRSTGPHLHFEVLRDGAPTDPRRYLAGL
jgi:murein DD-endopeptidase MepM/ murein hydrolase activator NlpD